MTLKGPAAGLDVALHEYVHHLQATLPGLQRLFRTEHRRRTTKDGKRDPLTKFWGGRHRKDRYLDRLEYMGKDYGAKTESSFAPSQYDMQDDGDAQEVATVAYQVLLHSYFGEELLGKLAKHDPGMLDLALGVLFRFDP